MMEGFELSPASNAWPLLFKYRGPVLGQGFIAVVVLHGRLLARQSDESGALWIDGVNPGALALEADSIRAAALELRSALTKVLVDFAEEAESFEAFKAEVVRFFEDTDAETVGEWEACVAEVQSGRLKAPGLLPVLSASATPPYISVTQKAPESVTPKDNPEPEPVLASVA
jgi:hypothetical protein